MDTTTATPARRKPKNEECFGAFYAHRLRQVAALAAGQCQRGIGLTTLLGGHLRQLWADLPPEFADDLTQCLADAGAAATLFEGIQTRLDAMRGPDTTTGDAA